MVLRILYRRSRHSRRDRARRRAASSWNRCSTRRACRIAHNAAGPLTPHRAGFRSVGLRNSGRRRPPLVLRRARQNRSRKGPRLTPRRAFLQAGLQESSRQPPWQTWLTSPTHLGQLSKNLSRTRVSSVRDDLTIAQLAFAAPRAGRPLPPRQDVQTAAVMLKLAGGATEELGPDSMMSCLGPFGPADSGQRCRDRLTPGPRSRRLRGGSRGRRPQLHGRPERLGVPARPRPLPAEASGRQDQPWQHPGRHSIPARWVGEGCDWVQSLLG